MIDSNNTIKRNMRLGELDAEADEYMLDYCFQNNGELDELLDIESPKSVILGRTGAGKSALIYKAANKLENCSNINPNDISIRFLEHSNIIQFFNGLGVKIDLFYKILWRHILTVELLKLRYNLTNEAENKSFLERIKLWGGENRKKKKALSYFEEWGNKFWLETDEHLKELTSKFTQDMKAKIGVKYPSIDVSAEGINSLSNESKTEIKSLATQVVSEIQIQRLTEVLKILSEEAFSDKQKRYYILIDKLDEDWAETETRCRFIRALIEETKSMRKIPQIKIISALRVDLLDLVFDKTRDSGFQEEKYEAYISKIIWSKSKIENLLKTRVKAVYKKQYTADNVEFDDVFPKEQHGVSAIDYIIKRTMLRPRDAIQFANECFNYAIERPRISWATIHGAESIYSDKRLKSLNEEWSEFYPQLKNTIEVLRGLNVTFTRSSIAELRLEKIADELATKTDSDPCVRVCKKLYEAAGKSATIGEFLTEIIISLYHVGAIGVKISTQSPYIWSYTDQPRISRSEAKRMTSAKVHSMLIRALDIVEPLAPSGKSKK